MATSKTLAPTGVTIQIPDFTEKPDQRVNSNCIDKEADAINELNNNFNTIQSVTVTTGTNWTKEAGYAWRLGSTVFFALRIKCGASGNIGHPCTFGVTPNSAGTNYAASVQDYSTGSAVKIAAQVLSSDATLRVYLPNGESMYNRDLFICGHYPV